MPLTTLSLLIVKSAITAAVIIPALPAFESLFVILTGFGASFGDLEAKNAAPALKIAGAPIVFAFSFVSSLFKNAGIELKFICIYFLSYP